MGTAMCVRDGGAPPAADHRVLRTFDEI
jgi:hypothetical protein